MIWILTDKAREARNAYKRKWYKENPEKRREYERRYWEKMGQAASESATDPTKAQNQPQIKQGEC